MGMHDRDLTRAWFIYFHCCIYYCAMFSQNYYLPIFNFSAFALFNRWKNHFTASAAITEDGTTVVLHSSFFGSKISNNPITVTFPSTFNRYDVTE